MTVSLSYVAGASAQFFNNNGTPLAGGFLYTYAAGTSTPLATFTSNSGLTSNANPIVLNSSGRLANEVWLTTGSNYKFALYDSASVLIATYDNIPGVGDASAVLASLAASSGSSLIGFIQSGTGAVAETVQAKLRQIVNVMDFGAAVDGVTDDTTAIQAALNTTRSVYIPAGITCISATLKFKKTGQILCGAGDGDNGGTGLTVIKAITNANLKMISWFDGTLHYSNCSVRDLLLNGNALANQGLRLYDDSSAGGCWRAFVLNVGIIGVTNGSTPTAVYGGAGTGVDNANDFNLHHVCMFGSARGIVSGGAIGSLTGRCTIQGATTAGVTLSAGAAISLGDTTFSANAWDIIASNAQKVSAGPGAWFENSTSGIYQSSTGHDLSINNSFLNTANATRMMDFGSSSGHHKVDGCKVSGTTSSGLIQNVNASALGSYDSDGLTATFATTLRPVPMFQPKKLTGTAGVWTTNGSVAAAGTLSLSLGRGCFIITVNAWRTSTANTRTSQSFTAFLLDGDSETVTSIASDSGSGGGVSFTVAANNNAILFTNNEAFTIDVYMAASGVIG